MMISKINSTLENIYTKQNSVTDNGNLQTKLIAEQRRLRAVDSDANMNESEKAKEKLKIQQQIDDLNRKMKMEELEKESADTKKGVQGNTKEKVDQSKESNEKKTEAVEATNKSVVKEESTTKEAKKTEAVKESKTAKETEEKNTHEKQVEKEEKNKNLEKLGISPQEIHKMLNLEFELQKERVLNRVSDKKEGMADVLRAEMKSDVLQGTDTELKEAQLAEMRKQKPIQIETIEPDKMEKIHQFENSMKIVIK